MVLDISSCTRIIMEQVSLRRGRSPVAQECLACLDRVEQLDLGIQEAERLRRQVLRAREAARCTDNALCGKMLAAQIAA